jgi:HEAT repeat protein
MLKVATLALLIVSAFAVAPVLAQQPSASPSPPVKRLELIETDPELRQVVAGINQNHGSLSGIMWTLTHAYESKEEMERALSYFIDFLQKVEANDAAKIAELGGGKGFKDKFASFLESKDGAVKGFAAAILGIVGDRSYAPRLATLVNERDPSFTDRYATRPTIYRGRAAMALATLNATEYKPDIAKLLASANYLDRSGAVSALAEMKAVEYTSDIAGLLSKNELGHENDPSPIYFLVETNQAKNFKPQLVRTMLSRSSGNAGRAAAYALAAVGAKEHARDVATLLTDEFRMGTAAKVLALLQARQYIPQIADLLNSKSGLVRNDATFALAILRAKQYAPRIAKVMTLKTNDGSTVYAAEAIFLMGATAHYPAARNALAFKISDRPFPMSGDLHPLVAEQTEVLRKRLESAIEGSGRN